MVESSEAAPSTKVQSGLGLRRAVLGKLGAASRTEAVDRARDLDLVP